MKYTPTYNYDLYRNYYVNQARQRGGGMPHFAGARYQRGHGLGAIFSRLRAALPSLLKMFGRHAIRAGANIADDVLGGKRFGEVVGRHAMDGAKSAFRDIQPKVMEVIKEPPQDQPPQTGSGKRRRKVAGKRKRCCISPDIFS